MCLAELGSLVPPESLSRALLNEARTVTDHILSRSRFAALCFGKGMASAEVAQRSESSTNHTNPIPTGYWISLTVLYLLVFIGGIVGVIMMSTTLMSNVLSVTRVSIINLLVVHVFFLLTVPFHVYYYISNNWKLGSDFCFLVSSMLHVHMYLSFIFYAIILCTRFMTYFESRQRLEFYRTRHAVIASATIWATILVIVIPNSIQMSCGSGTNTTSDQCFVFGDAPMNTNVKVLNYIICTVVLLIWIALASCQCYILWRVCRKHRNVSWVHQEFWAQIKSLSFVLIMLICFVPYQAFRIYYLSTCSQELQKVNEFFLSVTAFSCFDMLVFAGRGLWQPACKMCCVS
ncbi:putative G-protein coupled receptor 141 [Clarias gariepinus]